MAAIKIIHNNAMNYDKPETIEKGIRKFSPLFKKIARSGDKILIKPNFATDHHRYGLDPRSIMANGTVITSIANQFKKNSVIIGDNPIADADFKEIIRINGLKDTKIPILDLRSDYYPKKVAKIIGHEKLKGDPKGYTIVDLGKDSEFNEISNYHKRYRTTSGPDPKKPLFAHDKEKNIYSIPKSILDADAVISVAKLKTHKKVGVTLTIKNMIGLTNRKDWIPHYRTGSPPKGDEHPKNDLYQKIHEASWYGSDTVWRASIDLMKILIYADKDGIMQNKPQRKFFSIIDGVIAGEGEGPLAPTPKYCMIIIGGFDPVIVDATCAKIMGFNPEKIKIIYRAAKLRKYRLGSMPKKYPKINLEFKPPNNWVGHI